jgi:hypothetical protein
MVTVSTRRKEKQVDFSTGYGTGIPESVKSKIFQPFFTPSPPEKDRTGIVSSYDIITKGMVVSLIRNQGGGVCRVYYSTSLYEDVIYGHEKNAVHLVCCAGTLDVDAQQGSKDSLMAVVLQQQGQQSRSGRFGQA